MFLVDTEQGRIIDDEEIKQGLASEKPYREWLNEHMVRSRICRRRRSFRSRIITTLVQPAAHFGYTHEDLRILMAPMAKDGEEAIGSMGTDTPLAVLPTSSQLLYNYFKQLFAQVTNPPLDAIREELVTSMGYDDRARRQPAEAEKPRMPDDQDQVAHLDNDELARLRQIERAGFKSSRCRCFSGGVGRRGAGACAEDLQAAHGDAAEGLHDSDPLGPRRRTRSLRRSRACSRRPACITISFAREPHARRS